MFTNSTIVNVIIPMIQNKAELREYIAQFANSNSNVGTFEYHAAKFIRFLDTGNPEFSVFAADGNVKLPFVAFSSLAVATCPGRGACEVFCYSKKAWRYPAAFFKQLQNMLLLETHSGRAHILSALDALLARPKFANKTRVDFRLYVDGDFSNTADLAFWMGAISARPQLRAYGYSKSWQVFADYQSAGMQFPTNYTLNLSSGSSYAGNSELTYTMENLPITRGHFIAVPIVAAAREFSAPNGDYATKKYRDRVRSAFNAKAFVCPGKCGECTGAGHACGLPNMNVPIVIGIHR